MHAESHGRTPLERIKQIFARGMACAMQIWQSTNDMEGFRRLSGVFSSFCCQIRSTRSWFTSLPRAAAVAAVTPGQDGDVVAFLSHRRPGDASMRVNG
jgi:hypothetical protein